MVSLSDEGAVGINSRRRNVPAFNNFVIIAQL